MASQSIDSLRGGQNRPDGQSGQFQGTAGNEPAANNKHQPGKLVGNDAVPEFSAQTLPPGSAPADRTFAPNTALEDQSTAPPVERYMKDGVRDPESQSTSAADTLIGASSADVHTGLGHPGAGQTSAELRHDGQHHRKNPGSGLDGRLGGANQSDINPHDPAFADQRALNDDNAQIGRGDVPPAEERLPEGAQTVASENKIGRDRRAYGS
ncbi:Hypothetical predicted protein [Lecanosticta acicola]|uniref:Uncharacterized protein n=1 Tax=Lecanosticta acicola TaxID=111012 RepID=A0AAI8YS18_9PEZI|nr:Hypothetical predicted protein [Lecanosticta acicola]